MVILFFGVVSAALNVSEPEETKSWTKLTNNLLQVVQLRQLDETSELELTFHVFLTSLASGKDQTWLVMCISERTSTISQPNVPQFPHCCWGGQLITCQLAKPMPVQLYSCFTRLYRRRMLNIFQSLPSNLRLINVRKSDCSNCFT